jgi:hypothetical protein
VSRVTLTTIRGCVLSVCVDRYHATGDDIAVRWARPRERLEGPVAYDAGSRSLVVNRRAKLDNGFCRAVGLAVRSHFFPTC